MTKYKVIGVMSGTSLDGLDIAYCEFYFENNKWGFDLINQRAVSYNENWVKILSDLENASAIEYVKIDVALGEFFGNNIYSFIKEYNLQPDFIASHGHTIFHQPEVRLTTQIGNGASITAICHIPVINNFRVADVALGGQGAPLVSIGDKLLFPDFNYCLNLGGFANMTFQATSLLAFDICPCNIVLNHLAQKLGFAYDKGGRLAKNGKFNKVLFDQLNTIKFYQNIHPKSLGKEWVMENIFPIFESIDLKINDIIHTFCEHIAFQINKVIKSVHIKNEDNKLLITGGGAFNNFLISVLGSYIDLEIVTPSENIINYKEAIIFGFLGVLRWRNEPNCIQSVTGAEKDAVGGLVHSQGF